MKLSSLLTRLELLRTEGPDELEITGLFYDSRQVVPGGAFFALRGSAADGHQFIPQALAQGAKAVFMEDPAQLPAGVAGVLVANGRQAMAAAASLFYGEPLAEIPLIGVTGTNGKTTVTYLTEALLRRSGRQPAVIGTINYRCGELTQPASHTTPESVDLFRTLARFREAGADAVVMEVSSHALDQDRIGGMRFDVGVFTNLTPEHLDYHGDMESYYASKRRLFSCLKGKGRAVINVDDPFGVRLASEVENPLTCGLGEGAMIRPVEVSLSLDGISGRIATPGGEVDLRSALLGRFNLQNLLCAIGVGVAMRLPPAAIGEALATAPQVPGRLERVENGLGALILVDYAHTGDALDKVLSTLADLTPRRIITVFGCGGDRDRKKRPIMGEVVARTADLSILTSDNPRTEDPLAILEEIRVGAERVYPREWTREEAVAGAGRGYHMIPDRRQAIGFAVGLLQPGDLLLVAGKGHEDYQIIGRERFHFDDREELRLALQRRQG